MATNVRKITTKTMDIFNPLAETELFGLLHWVKNRVVGCVGTVIALG